MTVRIGVIGTGAIGRDQARRINQVLAGGKVVALSDVNRASAEAVKADIAPDATVYATGEELIAAADVDAVLVTSWGATHEQYVLAASAAGKPCFCEKPLASSYAAARKCVATIGETAARRVFLGFLDPAAGLPLFLANGLPLIVRSLQLPSVISRNAAHHCAPRSWAAMISPIAFVAA